MSRIADIVLIVSEADENTVQALSFWMSTAEAGDLRPRRDGLGDRESCHAAVGHLVPLNGPVAGRTGRSQVSGCVWAAVTNRLHWGRFLDRVRHTAWVTPERVQLLLKDDGDSYYRMYMLIDGELRNVVPAPADSGYDRDW